MKFQQLLLGMVVAWLLSPDCAQATDVAVYAQSNTQFDRRNEYPVKLLELALKNSGFDIALVSSQEIIPQGRAMKLILHNEGVDVVWAMTSREREMELLPIRVPIYKGLIGWRLNLIHPDNRGRFSGITWLEQLPRDVRFVQGHDWPDLDILRFNRLSVESVANYLPMFKMIAAKHVDAFPRAIIEIWPELEVHDGIQVEPYLILQYPAAVYYFVNRTNKRLHDAIATGLEVSIANGDFDRLFNVFYMKAIERAQLDKRHIIELENPLLPAETPLDDERLWYR